MDVPTFLLIFFAREGDEIKIVELVEQVSRDIDFAIDVFRKFELGDIWFVFENTNDFNCVFADQVGNNFVHIFNGDIHDVTNEGVVL